MSSLLEKIDNSSDLKELSIPDLAELSKELRKFIIDTISETGGHLAPTLGVIELTLALHYVFDTPIDKIVWDVGHQAYAHKIITGRRDKFNTIRQYNGLSGFPKIFEAQTIGMPSALIMSQLEMISLNIESLRYLSNLSTFITTC